MRRLPPYPATLAALDFDPRRFGGFDKFRVVVRAVYIAYDLFVVLGFRFQFNGNRSIATRPYAAVA
jgi:hypothetical protein